MSIQTGDTICAVATAPGGAGRGMVRISGPASVAIAAQLFESADHRSLDTLQRPTAVPGCIRIELEGARRELPCDLFLWPTARSYTREPVAELHAYGSPPVLASVLACVCRAGARLAEPGEFTLRAFLAGRIDLTQAEAVLGVIDAHGGEDLDAALTQLAGGLARPLHQLREVLLQLLAEIEAGLDFVEEDIEFISSAGLLERLESASQLLDAVAQQMSSRHVADDTAQIVLVGPPNAGKSSLFNALVKRFGCNASGPSIQQTLALVSPQRGTTRDYLTAPVMLNGIRCQLIDTAGIEELPDDAHLSSSIDATAQMVAMERLKQATIRAHCIESRTAPDEYTLSEFETGAGSRHRDIVVLTKADLTPNFASTTHEFYSVPPILTSSRTGQGLDELAASLHTLLMRNESGSSGQVVSATAERCRESVRLAENSLRLAAELVGAGAGNELVAVELRTALAELGKVVGSVYTEDLLDRIFGSFCIGK